MANEISSMTLASNLPSRPAQDSSQLAKSDSAQVAAATTGNTSPKAGNALPQQQQPVDQQQLRDAVNQINEYVQTVQRDLAFSVDGESGRTVIRVIDSSSGELIRQIPSEEVLALASYLQDSGMDSMSSGAVKQGILFSDST
jgi:flagellar protein FlaG